MRKITLIEGVKDAGKTTWIHEKFKSFKESGLTLVETKNQGYWNTEIFIFEDSEGGTIVLNSGSDTRTIINGFRDALHEFSNIKEIYTAIRPKDTNPHLHQWMIEALDIQKKI